MVLVCAVCYLLLSGCGGDTQQKSPPKAIPAYTVEVVRVLPHSRDAFTQGLAIDDGVLYEGTGQLGSSRLRRVDIESGSVQQEISLDDALFGEGIAIVGERIVQLTWKAKVGFVYDKKTFERLGEFHYETDGWGLTYDGKRLIMSDGSSTLHLYDPATLEYTGFLTVRSRGGPVEGLNELEYVRGELLANVWPTNQIARIDLQSGDVTGWIDGTGLLASADYTQPLDVLNGIAWDADADKLYLTGKLWPKLFEVRIVKRK